MEKLFNIEEYIDWLEEEGKTDNTISSYVKVVKYFEDWYASSHKEEIDYIKLKPIDLREWKKFLLDEAKTKVGEPLSIRTINNYIEGIKTFFRFLIDRNKLKYNPAEKLKPQTVKTEYIPRWLDPSEKRQIIRYVEDLALKEKNPWKYTRNRFIVFSMLHAGLRISEVENLKIFDIKNGYIQIRKGKGQAARDIPMNKTLSLALEEWLEQRNLKNPQNDYLLLSQKGGRLTTSGINKIIEKIREKTNLDDLTPHTLRHTFANDLLTNGHPMPYVAALLGHNDLDTTRVYTSPRQQNLKDAVESLSDEF